MLKKFLLFILLFLIFVLCLLALIKSDFFNSTNVIQDSSVESETVEEKIEPINFTMTAIGDTLCHNTQYWDAYNSSTKQYDFSYVYDDIKVYTSSADITIGSLETTFAGEDRGYSNYPVFNSPDSLATGLKDIGVDVISLAGNHALDYGYSGICRTIDVLDNVGISHLGTYKSAEDQNKILIKDVKGVKIAFINYTYGTNGIPVPSDKPYCLNLIDKDLISKQIKQATEQNVDMIVACMHWGTEYRTTANDEDVFVVYALGNFTADQRAEITRDSAILNLDITKDSDGKILINKVSYVPIYMYKNSASKVHKFKILDIEKSIANYDSGDTSIGSSVYSNLKVQLQKIRDILGDEIN